MDLFTQTAALLNTPSIESIERLKKNKTIPAAVAGQQKVVGFLFQLFLLFLPLPASSNTGLD